MRDSIKIIIACIVCLGIVGAAGVYVFLSQNKKAEERKIVTDQRGNVVVYKYEDEDDTMWRELVDVNKLPKTDSNTKFDVQDGFIVYLDKDGVWQKLVSTGDLMGAQGQAGVKGEQGAQGIPGLQGESGQDGRSVELRSNSGYLQWRYTSGYDQEWKNLVAMSAISGMNGVDGHDGTDGRSIEVTNTGNAIAWRYIGESDSDWRTIITVAALKGEEGPTGIPGEPGEKGDKGDKGDTGDKGDPGDAGPKGDNGKSIEIQKTDTEIQWKYEGDEQWKSLITLDTLTGKNGADGINGKSVEIRKNVGDNKTTIQWSYYGEDSWVDIIDIEAIRGEKGDPGEQGPSGVPGKDGREVELTLFPGAAAVTPDPNDPESTGAPAQAPAIRWRYAGETEWRHLLFASQLKGERGETGKLESGMDLKIVDHPADPNEGIDAGKWFMWKPKDAPDSAWEYLCPIGDINFITPAPVNKNAWSATNGAPSVTLEDGKQYMLYITVTGVNDQTSAVTTSVTCGGQTVNGTWPAATTEDDGQGGITTKNSSATYSGSFLITGTGSAASYTGPAGLADSTVTITITEI